MTYAKDLAAAHDRMVAPRDRHAPMLVSTFAGAGGSSMGYAMAGYRELLATDWDAHSCACLRENFPDADVIEGDIAGLSADDILGRLGLNAGSLDLLDGSPPCQGFSIIGKRLIDDDRNALFRHFCSLLEGLRPRAFVMENVSGMVKGHMKLVFAEILRELKSRGYVTRAWVMNAKWFGVPQARERVFFVGVRDDLGIEPTPPGPTCDRPVSVIEACELRMVGTRNGIPSGILMTGDEAGRGIRLDRPAPTVAASGFGKVWRRGFGIEAADDTGPALLMPGPRPNFSTQARAKRGSLKRPRLFANEIDVDALRTLSVGEIMRLQSFPDQYRWPEGTTWSKAWARVGNSVPPLMMEAIARHVRTTVLELTR